MVADPHPSLRDHPHDPWVSLDQVADHEEARRSVEPLQDVHHLFRLDGPRAVVERQRDLAVGDAATDGNLTRRHHVAGDRAFDRDPADPEPSERAFRVAEMPTGQTFDRPAGPLDAVGAVLHEDGVSGFKACEARRRTTVQLDAARCVRGIQDRTGDRQELTVMSLESEAFHDVAEGRARSDLVRRVANGDLERRRGRRCSGLAGR